jgi:hypothetical protein
MGHMGHADPAFTLRAYAKTMARSEAELDALRSLLGGAVLAADGAFEVPRGQRAWA